MIAILIIRHFIQIRAVSCPLEDTTWIFPTFSFSFSSSVKSFLFSRFRRNTVFVTTTPVRQRINRVKKKDSGWKERVIGLLFTSSLLITSQTFSPLDCGFSCCDRSFCSFSLFRSLSLSAFLSLNISILRARCRLPDGNVESSTAAAAAADAPRSTAVCSINYSNLFPKTLFRPISTDRNWRESWTFASALVYMTPFSYMHLAYKRIVCCAENLAE